jgi:hypothetical protein
MNQSLPRTAARTARLAFAFLCSALAHGQSSPALFPVVTTFATAPTQPFFVGDINGDGKLDLAYAYPGVIQSVGIILNFGSNSATTVTTNLCSAGGQGPTLEDVNNDKKLDLIYACNGFLAVQFGNGDGTFQPVTYFGAYTYANAIFADFNGDGYLDIASLTIASGATPTQISLFLNKGATAPGAFAAATVLAVPNGTLSLSAGDFNGDGKQDVLAAFRNSSFAFTGLSVLYGNGDGTFQAAQTQTNPEFNGYATGDFNQDGATDVALLLAPGQGVNTSVQILLGSKSESFTQGASFALPATEFQQGLSAPMAAVPLTNDGSLDLVVFTSVMTVLHGDGKGGFTLAGTYDANAQSTAQPTGTGYAFADINGDGHKDLLEVNQLSTLNLYPGNGDGTFQALPAVAFSGAVTDVNNDGIADMVFYGDNGGSSYFATALGRGDGNFALLSPTTTLPGASSAYVLIPGDFNGDGKADVAAMQVGPTNTNFVCETTGAQLLLYTGSGDGRFQATGSALALNVNGAAASSGIAGDFNNDGKLDLLLYYKCSQSGLLLVTGHGDGTFANPIDLTAAGNGSAVPLVGDLNHDGKLDFISGTIVSLGNGDGTFRQLPLTLPSNIQPVALADLNGDGIPDVISGATSAPGGGGSVYAGVGDGTFQATPFFTVPLAAGEYQYSAAAADVNGDGHADLTIGENGSNGPLVAIFLGDGHGNFTADTNTYFVPAGSNSSPAPILPARLNQQAAALPGDNRLDLLIGVASEFRPTATVSLLNQTNPAPLKPSPIASVTTLQASATTAAAGASITLTASVAGTSPTGSISFVANGNSLGTEALVNGVATLTTSFASAGSYAVTAAYGGDSQNTASTSAAVAITVAPAMSATTLAATPTAGDVNAQITLQATVTGNSPTGTVSFAAGTTILGTATLTNGVATLKTSFAAAGSYATTATYAGDSSNAASTSSAVTIVIAAPDFTITATPPTQTVMAGQTATFTFTVTPVAGFASAVSFSCGPLPASAACSFSPASATPTGGSPANSTLTITTQTTAASLQQPTFWMPASGLAFAGVMGLLFAPGRLRRWNRQMRWLSWALVVVSVSLVGVGCGGGGSAAAGSQKTPAGSYTVAVNASNSGGSQHAASLTLVVQ